MVKSQKELKTSSDMRGKNHLQMSIQSFLSNVSTCLAYSHIQKVGSSLLSPDFLQDKLKVGNHDHFHDDQNCSWACNRFDQGYPSGCADISLAGWFYKIDNARRAIHRRGESVSFFFFGLGVLYQQNFENYFKKSIFLAQLFCSDFQTF